MVKFISLLPLLFLSPVALGFPLSLPGNAELESELSAKDGVHQVLLSAPKRVSNALRIENSVQVKGKRTDYLLRIRTPSDSRSAYESLLADLEESGSLVFKCDERACGSSNYWANTILKERKLYGRDSEQYYFAGNLDIEGKSSWLTAYAVKNGRKQDYVFVSVLVPNGESSHEWVNGIDVSDQKLTDEQRSFIESYLAENPTGNIWLKASIYAEPLESFEALKSSTDESVLSFRREFARENGLPEKRIKIFSVGGLSAKRGASPGEPTFEMFLFMP